MFLKLIYIVEMINVKKLLNDSKIIKVLRMNVPATELCGSGIKWVNKQPVLRTD